MKNYVFVLLTAAFLLPNCIFGAVSVSLKSGSVEISAEKIYVKDVAVVMADNSAAKEKIEGLYLKMSAIPGHRVSVTRERLENVIRRYYPDADFFGAEKVYVITKSTKIDYDSVTEAAVKYVMENMPWKKEDAEIITKNARRDINLIKGEVLLKVKEDNSVSFKGNVIVPVEVYVNGKFEKIEPVSFIVKVTTDCLMAATDMPRGSILSQDMVKVIKKDITDISGDVLTDLSQVQGFYTKRGIPAGTILLNNMFDRLPLFKRGEPVSVIVKIGSLSVETTGIPNKDGKEGELVKVKLQTGKTLDGKVSPDGRVIIEK
ncbi:MAG: flagella basal body P-ring formation protein FlgA [Candidatus Goldiibacteriota bacterium HGW-Goldbacteria-1]|jgi:flagella basal body P-ring formation protein FlgA|nr:MAG: flagella basal body P-ring formation protein FlgA [Candidatus Goldiibacteriota bacterium HGW-Goldbacteria-1]